jgi:hypothetical protein
MGFPVSDQFIPLHSQIVPALAGRHATFAADALDRISKHSVSLRLGSGDTGRAQDGKNRSTGKKLQKASSIHLCGRFFH